MWSMWGAAGVLFLADFTVRAAAGFEVAAFLAAFGFWFASISLLGWRVIRDVWKA